jgi:long-chain acyl-CoA synthetase
MNLAAIACRSAERLGGRAALTLDGTDLTYRALARHSARVAALLRRRGIRPGDRVAVMLPNVPEFAIVFFGVLWAGAVVVPVNPQLKRREIAHYLDDCGASLLLAWHAVAEVAEAGATRAGTDCLFVVPEEFDRLLAKVPPDPRLRQLAERRPEDTAVILYTAGTAGRPKGAELTNDNLAGNAREVARMHAMATDDVVLGALPMFHAYGLTCTLITPILAGARVTLLPRFGSRAALEVMARDGVTVLHGVPTMYITLLDHVGRFAAGARGADGAGRAAAGRAGTGASSLRVCATGGAPMPVDVMRSVERAFGCAMAEGYGLSETSPVAALNPAGRERRIGSIGRPIRGVEMTIRDPGGGELPPGATGEIAIRGPNVMKGYWNDPAATAKAIRDGWFYTGDLGRVDGDGYFYLVDRKKDVIIRGGHTVYPREVEEVLYEHPAVREAAVIGIPHARLGAEVAAVVGLGDGAGSGGGAGAVAAELRAFVKDRVAAYKYPRHVRIVDELPKGPTGKILKRAIATAVPSTGRPAG